MTSRLQTHKHPHHGAQLPSSPLLRCTLFHCTVPPDFHSQISEPSQVQGAAFALQLGVDALLLRPEHDLWTAAVGARKQRNAAVATAPEDTLSTRTTSDLDGAGVNAVGGTQEESGVALCAARVTGTREGGVGDRVCVDLIQNLRAGEGMLVGSSGKLLALVHAETFETGFVPAR